MTGIPSVPVPGEIGNSYIVGHSSNFSSVISPYNEVFKPLVYNSKINDRFYVWDQNGRKLIFRVYENIELEYGNGETDKDRATAEKYALSPKLLNVNETGSLVFGGDYIGLLKKKNASEFGTLLAGYLVRNPIKKIGICIPTELANGIIGLAKRAGAKKVNIIHKPEPNFGDYKHTKNWITVFFSGGQWHVGAITTFSNQEYWAKLDMDMPHRDMKRGIINLKLARSIVNLAGGDRIWDPFCGQGRLMIAGLDRTKFILGSDIDQTILPDAIENIEQAKRIMFSNHHFLKLEGEMKTAQTVPFFTHDASTIPAPDIEWSEYNVATEGYLGETFSKPPNLAAATTELEKIWKLWSGVLSSFSKIGTQRIVTCLPYYPNISQFDEKYYQENINSICGKLFKLEQSPIWYSRDTSNTGHLVIVLQKI
jgi:hypothetical protein